MGANGAFESRLSLRRQRVTQFYERPQLAQHLADPGGRAQRAECERERERGVADHGGRPRHRTIPGTTVTAANRNPDKGSPSPPTEKTVRAESVTTASADSHPRTSMAPAPPSVPAVACVREGPPRR